MIIINFARWHVPTVQKLELTNQENCDLRKSSTSTKIVVLQWVHTVVVHFKLLTTCFTQGAILREAAIQKKKKTWWWLAFMSTDLVWVRTMEQVKRWMATYCVLKVEWWEHKINMHGNWSRRKKRDGDKTEEGWEYWAVKTVTGTELVM